NFGLYATTGRALGFLGTAAFAATVAIAGDTRTGILGIVLVMAVGLIAFLPIRLGAAGRASLTQASLDRSHFCTSAHPPVFGPPGHSQVPGWSPTAAALPRSTLRGPAHLPLAPARPRSAVSVFADPQFSEHMGRAQAGRARCTTQRPSCADSPSRGEPGARTARIRWGRVRPDGRCPPMRPARSSALRYQAHPGWSAPRASWSLGVTRLPSDH